MAATLDQTARQPEMEVVSHAPLLLFAHSGDYIQYDINGHVRKDRKKVRPFPLRHPDGPTFQQKLLTWLRDNVNQKIPDWYYSVVLGHPLHISTWGTLMAKHYPPAARDPFHPLRAGCTQNLAVLPTHPVTGPFARAAATPLPPPPPPTPGLPVLAGTPGPPRRHFATPPRAGSRTHVPGCLGRCDAPAHRREPGRRGHRRRRCASARVRRGDPCRTAVSSMDPTR